MCAARPGGQAGFSLIETVFVVGIIGILSGMAVLVSGSWVAAAKADGGLDQVVSALRTARERAIADRRNIEVRFQAPNQIAIVRRDVVGNVEAGTTVLETITIEGSLRFHLPTGVPDLAGADDLVPGTGDSGINDGTAAAEIFTAEGTLVDQTGDPLNVEVFIAQGDDRLSSRAVTVFGPTAFIRGYTWNGSAWTR
jgi:prepilin-type N-terminal cleavage/methylation domain-containing protein